MNEKSNHWISMTKMLTLLGRVNLMLVQGTSIGTDLARDENGPTITRQIDAHPVR